MSALDESLRYRSLVDRLGAIVWEATPGRAPGEATFTFVSEHTESLLGYPPARWTSDTHFWIEIIHPDDRDRVNAAIVDVVRSGRGDFEYRARAADGREVWLRNIVQVDTSVPQLRLTGVLTDVTARKASDVRLLRLQDFTDALAGVTATLEAARVIAAKGRDAAGALAAAVVLRDGDELEVVGYEGPPNPHLQLGWRFTEDLDVPIAEVIRSGETLVLSAEELAERYPNLPYWSALEHSGALVSLPLCHEGRVLGAVSLRLSEGQAIGPEDRVVLDVLERASVSALLRAEQATAERDSRAVIDAIITTAPEAFALFDTDLRYVRVNDALAETHGLPAADHVGRALEEVFPGSAHAAPLRRVLETGEPIVDIEVSGTVSSGPKVWLTSYYPVPNAQGQTGWLGKFMVDITARKRAEQRTQLFAELGARLDAGGRDGSVEARMTLLADTLVPDPCASVAVRLRGPAGQLEPVAARGTAAPAHRLPLQARGRDLGTIELAFVDPGEPDEDRAFAAEIAGRAALVVDSAQLFEGERRARERTERQYAVAASLAEALDPAAVAAVTLHEIIPAVRAEQGTMWLYDEAEGLVRCIGWHGFSDEEMSKYVTAGVDEHRPVADAVRSRRLIHLPDSAAMDAAYPDMARLFRVADLQSMVVFPLVTAGRVAGGLLVSARHADAFGEDDLALGTALGAQAAQALERARLFEAERRVSVTLQRSLLPAALPEVEGVELDLRYLPAAGLEAGGDFYEAVPLADGTLVIAVGDVVGRGATAAAAMGQLRSALRAYALTGDSPAALLTRLSVFADTLPEAMAATAVVAKLDPVAGELVYACAGHPWPVYVTVGGEAELLQGGRGVPLGCLPEPQYREDILHLTPGATLLLYTDGLTERRGEDMDAALERLRVTVGERALAPLPDLLDHAVADAGPVMPADDVALVVLRFTGAAGARRLALPGGDGLGARRPPRGARLVDRPRGGAPSHERRPARGRRGHRQRRGARRRRDVRARPRLSHARRHPHRRARRRPLEGPRRQPAPGPRLRADADAGGRVRRPARRRRHGRAARPRRRARARPGTPAPSRTVPWVARSPTGAGTRCWPVSSISPTPRSSAVNWRSPSCTRSISRPSPTWTPPARGCSSSCPPAPRSSPRPGPQPGAPSTCPGSRGSWNCAISDRQPA